MVFRLRSGDASNPRAAWVQVSRRERWGAQRPVRRVLGWCNEGCWSLNLAKSSSPERTPEAGLSHPGEAE